MYLLVGQTSCAFYEVACVKYVTLAFASVSITLVNTGL